MYVYLHNGRTKYRAPVSPESAANVAVLKLENIYVLGKYDAVFDKEDSSIEAVVRPVNPNARATVGSRFMRLPGVEIFEPGELFGLLFRVTPGASSLEIPSCNYETHDKCVEYLEQIAASLFFDMDFRFNIAYSISRQTSRALRAGRRQRTDERPITIPRAEYSVPATTLYFHATSMRVQAASF